MKNFKNKTLYQQLQESDKKYFKIKKNFGREHLGFSSVRKTTICKFSKKSFVKIELTKNNKINPKLNLSVQNFLTIQTNFCFLHKKMKIAALGGGWPWISQQPKLKSENLKLSFFRKREEFLQKNKITFREYLKKRLVLSDCLSPQKMKNQNHFLSQSLKRKPTLSWKKSITTVYYLLLAYKKTMRVKLNYYFNNSTNLQFFLALSPFLGYFLQTSFEKYELQYQQNTFFNKNLPGLKKPMQEINWETYSYTKYSTKLNSKFITQVNSVDDCFFISLNPRWQFKQKQLSTATFEILPSESRKQGSSNSVTKWSFLPSRYFYKLLQQIDKQGFNEVLLGQTKNCVYVTAQFLPVSQSEQVETCHSVLSRDPKNQIPSKTLPNSKTWAEKNPNSEATKQKSDLKKMSLGGVCSKAANFQPKIAKVSSEIRFWKNFKFALPEINQNLDIFKVGENQSQYREFSEQSKTDRNKFQSSISKFSSKCKNTGDFKSLNSDEFNFKKQMALNSNWQLFFNELDDIPTKLNSLFQQEPISFKKIDQTVKSPLIFSFSGHMPQSANLRMSRFSDKKSFDFSSTHVLSFDSSRQTWVPKEVNSNKYLDDSYKIVNNKFSFSDFKECFNLLESNYKKSNRKFIEDPLKSNLNKSSFNEKSQLVSKKLSFKKNLSQKPASVLPGGSNANFKFTNPYFCASGKSHNFSVNSNLVKKKLVLLKKRDLIEMEKIPFNSFKEADQTWIHLLTKIFNRPVFKNEPPLVLDRNFQYNIDFGFSQLGNLINLNVLTPNIEKSSLSFDPHLLSEAQKQESNFEKSKKTTFPLLPSVATQKQGEFSAVFKDLENRDSQMKGDFVNEQGKKNSILTTEMNAIKNASSFEILPKSISLILKNAIREDLRSPLSSWILEAKNLQQSCKLRQNKSQNLRLGTYPVLLKLTNYENFFLKHFKFNNVVTNSLLKRPQSILELVKKSDIRSSQNVEQKKSFVLNCNELRREKKNFSLVQRKVSGYLYPDSLRNTVLTNTSFFNFNKSSNILNSNHSIKKYEPGFFKIISQNFLNQNKKSEKFQSSLIQVYQPLIPNSIDASYINSLNESFFNYIKNSKTPPSSLSFTSQANVFNFCPQLKSNDNSKSDRLISQTFLVRKACADAKGKKPGESILNFSKLQKGADYLNSIEPDESFTAKKEFFFGVPAVSPLYGINLKEYKEKFELRKKDIQKNHLVSPYENSLNFVLQSNSNLKRNPPHFLQNFFGDNLVSKEELSGQTLLKLETKSILNEITKATTFSNMFFEKPILFFPFKAYLIKESLPNIGGNIGLNSSFHSQKNEKSFQFEQRTIPYKTHFNYTKLRVFSNNLNKLEKSLKKSTFSTNLYEPISLKTWTLSSQIGFAFIVLKLASILYNEYREEMGYYINEFAVFFNEYEKNNFLDFLDFFNPKENFRVIKKTNKKFSDLVGGRFLLTEFGEVILLLRNSRKVFYRIGISKPQTVSFDTTSNFSKLLEPIFFNGKLNKKLKRRKLFVEKPNLKLENFIPKGILLIGPPGTGKTLLVKALSGEASVPVIVESGKMLTTNMENNGAERLKDLFKAAREMAPCILFLDEVDTIGQKRENVLSNFASGEKENQIPNTLNYIYLQNVFAEKLNSPISENFSDLNADILNPLLKLQTAKNPVTKKNQELKDLKTQITNQKISSGKQKYQDLIMLTQLLCELDGLNKRQEIIVIGATNRPATLDSALTRPGRFGKVIYLDLPGKQKRFELLKFYSHSKKDSLALFNNQRFEIGSFIPNFSSFSYSNADSKENFSPPPFNFNLILGQNFSKSEEFLKTAFFKMQKFVFPAALGRMQIFSLLLSGATKKQESGDFLKPSLPVLSKRKGYESLKRNQNLGIDENINWNYFANQTVGLSAAHLASAMNRSALKAIYIYLSQNQKEICSKGANSATVLNSSFFQLFLSEKHVKRQTIKNNPQNVFKKKRLQTLQEMQNFSCQKSMCRDERKQTSLTNNSEQIFNFIQMSKKSKLVLIAQSGLGKNEIISQLNLFSRKDLEHKVYQQEPLHNFETIEYGIQTISTMNTSLQLKITKGKKVNKKIIGQFTQDDFFLKSRSSSIPSVPKENRQEIFENLSFESSKKILTPPWSTSKNSTLDEMQSFVKEKQSSEKRNLFYQKHRRYLRTLAFLGGLEKQSSKLFLSEKHGTDTILKTNESLSQSANSKGHVLSGAPKLKRRLSFDFKNKNSFTIKNLGSLTLFQLKILSRYVNRIIQNQSLGWVLLFNSTCLIQNSFFLFSLQTQNKKNLNFIYYNLLFFNKTGSRTLLKWQNFNLLNQSFLFGDSLFINRSAYYLSGKVLTNVASRVEKRIDEPISLWSFTGSVQTRQKKTSDPSFEIGTQGKNSKLFLTKIQFENFILSLIAGKATETLMLANQLGIEKKNESTIGILELKELGLLIKLMGEKYLFYSQKQLNHKQININLLENEKQINQDEFLFLKELATLFEIQNKTLTNLPNNPLRSYDQFQSVDQPWWQLNSINLLASFNLKYGEWYRLFLAEEQQNFRNIEWIAPDTYFHNQLNNSQLILNKTNLLSQKKEKTNYFLNRVFVLKYIQFSKLNWNQIQLLESESVASYFLFESFNKSFNLLDKNREVVDSLVYSLICHESLRDFEILNNYRRYFK